VTADHHQITVLWQCNYIVIRIFHLVAGCHLWMTRDPQNASGLRPARPNQLGPPTATMTPVVSHSELVVHGKIIYIYIYVGTWTLGN